jgi:hypothetical protein
MTNKENQYFIFNGKKIKTGLTTSDKIRTYIGCLLLSALILAGVCLLTELIIRVI